MHHQQRTLRALTRGVAVACLWAAMGYEVGATDTVVIRFLTSPQVQHHVVRLGDVIEIVSGQLDRSAELLQAPLGPAPRPGQVQRWFASDILQHLELRGIHPSTIRWSGADQVEVRFTDPVTSPPMVPAFLNSRAISQAEQVVGLAIQEYVKLQSGSDTSWRVKVQLPEQLVDACQTKRHIVAIGGGQPPWTGEQQFTLKIRRGTEHQTVTITAEVSMPPLVVAANRAMRRGETISPDDLVYVPLVDESDRAADYFSDIDALVGKQLRRSVSTGLPILTDYVGDPILIDRGSLVQVESVAGAIVVSTQGRALGNGAAGELIEVEILATRQRVFALVIDPLTVRIVAQPQRPR
ncbi:MAG: hypothetical protein KatS3mg111_2288 [Pirellulaceae bacterium]|nr:MAG: hypothetical protein KatS3mg111_2288 [Pirellulaceae bacterium]